MSPMTEAKKWLDDWDRDAQGKLKLSLSEVREVLLLKAIELEKKERFPFLVEYKGEVNNG